MQENAQELMWSVVGDWWWTGYAVVCAIGGILLFVQILHSVERNALTIARLLWLGGFIVGAFVRFNSGCQPLSAALFATSGVAMTILLATRWCWRRGSRRDKIRAILREALYPQSKQRADGD